MTDAVIVSAVRTPVGRAPKGALRHTRPDDLAALEEHLERVPDGVGRVVVIFDGIFSMRGDHAPVDRIAALVARHPVPRIFCHGFFQMHQRLVVFALRLGNHPQIIMNRGRPRTHL